MNPNSQNPQQVPGQQPSFAAQSADVPQFIGDPRLNVSPSTPSFAAGPAQTQAPDVVPLPMPLPVTPQTAQMPVPQPVPMAGQQAYMPPSPAAPPLQPQAAAPVPQAAPGALTTAKNPGTQPAALPTNPNSTQNMLQIAEIRDGIVIMSDGSFRSIVMVNSINFDLMSQQEQEAVEYNYQNFLNSLYFPIQIFIRSQKVDLAPYIQKLDKIRSEHDNMLLALLMDDYISYMENISQQTNLMDKKFYIVIPFFPHIDIQKAFTQSKNFMTGFTALFKNKDQHVVINEVDLEKAKTELRNRVQTVLDGLIQCNIQSLPLDTQELIELFYDTYNPDTATRQQLKNFSPMNVDIVTKGQGSAPQPHLERELV